MPFLQQIHRLLFGILVFFGLVAVAAAYWTVFGSDTILTRDDNPRLVEAEARIQRGAIYDRNDTLLAQSLLAADGIVSREYLHPATNSTLGYFSLRYGVGGAEAAYDNILRGDDLPTDYFTQDILHAAQQGSDIRLSLDLDVQKEINIAMAERIGAVIILSVPDGQILALTSLPTYDPNTLDDAWDTLVDAPGNPFFNRVLQGSYQPGGTLQTLLMATAILTGYPVDTPIDNATRTVAIDDLGIPCAIEPAQETLTLQEAYAYACPAPFLDFTNAIGRTEVETYLQPFRLDQLSTLPGFIPVPEDQVEVTPSLELPIENDTLEEFTLGQGQLTITPLGIASVIASAINDGNAPAPTMLLAFRRPAETGWIPNLSKLPSTAMMTAETADLLRDLMIDNMGIIKLDTLTDAQIGGHASLAFAGDSSQAWFVGFVLHDDNQGIVIAVVLEDTFDPKEAVDIGISGLEAAHRSMNR